MTASMEIIGCSKFPHVLHRMLEDSKDDDDLAKVVSWMPAPITSDEQDGCTTSISSSFLMEEYNVPQCYCFKVHSNKEFCETVMPTYFTHQTRYKSFLRQLNMYGITRITKVGPNHGAYFHPLLVPGKAYLLDKIQRVHKRVTKSATTEATSSPPLPQAQSHSLGGLLLHRDSPQETRFKHLHAAINGSSNNNNKNNNDHQVSSNATSTQATFSFQPLMLNSQEPIMARPTAEARSLLGNELSSLPVLNQTNGMMKPSSSQKTLPKAAATDHISPIFGDDLTFGNNGSGSNLNKLSQSFEPIGLFHTMKVPQMATRDHHDSSLSLGGGLLQPQHSTLRDHFNLSRINEAPNQTSSIPTPMGPQSRMRSTSASFLSRRLYDFFADDVADDIVALFRTQGDVDNSASTSTIVKATTTQTNQMNEMAASWEV